MKTLDSIVNCTSKQQFSEIFIVILLADFNVTWRLEMASIIKDRYTTVMTNGTIQVIEAPIEFYPPLDNLQHTYNVSQLKRKWRSKQNVDYAFLWLYSKDLSTYYIQIEDDIQTVPGYINIIKQFISSQNGDWTCLEFGELGFIGKLYPTKYLERLAKTVLMFYEEQPVDFIYHYFNILNLQRRRIIRRPTIFQHVGYHSSLPGKVQTLTDKYFPDNDQKVIKGDNPPAKIVTTFRTSPDYPPEAAYSATDGYFWVQSSSRVHHLFYVLFKEPVVIEKVIVLTGSKAHPHDKIQDAKLDVCLSIRRNGYQIRCINEIYIGNFINGTIKELNLGTRLHNLTTDGIRITMTKNQETWIVFKEIAVFVKR
jgi:alpha-1,3-mannosylglycoprotein beta-1,4-N-acetylglucosaminyltransferase C